MNSPFLHEQTRRLTASVALPPNDSLATASTGFAADQAEGIRQLYRRVLGRPPEPDELSLALEFVRRQVGAVPAKPDRPSGSPEPRANGNLSPWEQLSQVLLLTNEFMFVD
jgi:hypothetical protein